MNKVLLSLPCLLVALNCYSVEPAAHHALAPTPPMGWNSYDAFGATVTEEEFLANARYMKEKLQSHGWQYVVVDFRWADPEARKKMFGNKGAPLVMDEYGRLLPETKRWPSAAAGKGFKPVADQVHAMGLKFGIHIMRGIPKLAVAQNLPIEGSNFRAADAAMTNSWCGWCPDMFGVDGSKPAGQAYYDSLFRLYASWGLDFVKVDDLSRPYHISEVEAVRKAIDKCGRPIVFSTSPGETPVKEAAHVVANANMWRIIGDFWDNWKSLDKAFDLVARWQGIGGPGHWPDSDMIPLGRIGIRCMGGSRMTKFTRDEQLTLMTLWSMAPSPLMFGGNLPDNDEWTLSMITNDEVLGVNQDVLGKPGVRVSSTKGVEVWSKDLADGAKAVAIFNRGVLPPEPPKAKKGQKLEAVPTPAPIPVHKAEMASISFSSLGLAGNRQVRDLWLHKDLPAADNFSAEIPPHGCVLLKVK